MLQKSHRMEEKLCPSCISSLIASHQRGYVRFAGRIRGLRLLKPWGPVGPSCGGTIT